MLRRILQVAAFAIAAIGTYAAYASWRYGQSPLAERPCEACRTPVTVKGFELFYREFGVDTLLPPIVLVHGGPGHSSRSFKDGFEFLGAQRRVIMYDQRGSGNSQSRNLPGAYAVDSLVEELEALRAQVIGADRVVLVGHSFGSAIVQRYALKYPERVDRLVIVAGVKLNNGVPSPGLWRLIGPTFLSTALGFPPADATAADIWFNATPDSARLFDPSRVELLANTGMTRFAVWRDVSLTAPGAAREDDLRALSTRTLFMYGAADATYTGKPVAEYLCGLIPSCEIAEFPRSGHWPFLEEPAAFQRVLSAFLATP